MRQVESRYRDRGAGQERQPNILQERKRLPAIGKRNFRLKSFLQVPRAAPLRAHRPARCLRQAPLRRRRCRLRHLPRPVPRRLLSRLRRSAHRPRSARALAQPPCDFLILRTTGSIQRPRPSTSATTSPMTAPYAARARRSGGRLAT